MKRLLLALTVAALLALLAVPALASQSKPWDPTVGENASVHAIK